MYRPIIMVTRTIELVTANDIRSSPVTVTLMIELTLPKRRFLQVPYGVTSPKKTTIFIMTDVRTPNLT
jgi:hypothetical protein